MLWEKVRIYYFHLEQVCNSVLVEEILSAVRYYSAVGLVDRVVQRLDKVHDMLRWMVD